MFQNFFGKKTKAAFTTNENSEINKITIKFQIEMPDESLVKLVECLGILLSYNQSTK